MNAHTGGGVVTKVNVIVCDMLVLTTIKVPDEGDDVYPFTLPTTNEYVSLFWTTNVIVLEVDDSVVPLTVTYHDVPDGRPPSVKFK